jgi:hypothetical protein
MHKVYRYSHCNIAVADSSDSEGGLFRQRKPSNIVPISFEADGSGKLERGTWRILKNDLWDDELLATKIYTRGWVFQGTSLCCCYKVGSFQYVYSIQAWRYKVLKVSVNSQKLLGMPF